MKLIVGLGNPGERYENTRHNLGFMTVERFVRDFEPAAEIGWKKSDKFKSRIADLEWKPKTGPLHKVVVVMPQTYMNNSGMAVGLISAYYKIEPADIWIVYDELDLPIGAMRIRFGGAAAGHRGVESIIESLGTDRFWRFRLGIGTEHPHSGRRAREDGQVQKNSKQFLGNANDYVLSPFGQENNNKARELIKHASDAISEALEKGLEKPMNRYNTK